MACKMWDVECTAWSVEGGIRSVVCVECGGVWSVVECGVWSVVRGVRSEECGVWSEECGVCRV